MDEKHRVSKDLAHVMVWVTPGLLLATNLARFSAEQRFPASHELLLIGVLTILAFVTDAVIVFGIRHMSTSVAYLWFLVQVKHHQRKIKSMRHVALKSAREADAQDAILRSLVEGQDRQDTPAFIPEYSQITKDIFRWFKNGERPSSN